ncbi:MAG: serine/threonine protein kinase [Myxococcales bacterium]|nr:serine/threonine protein kinase [Myxococcales bacterium]
MNDGPLAAGEVVDGRYRIDAQVGRGGMGVVYRGTDLTLRRAVAIKVLQARGGGSDTIKRFMREAQALAQVEHRGLVPVYAVGRAGDLYYMVMKFIEGQTLSQILKTDAPLAPARLIPILVDVCGALQALHMAGLVHRDMKPANVMVGADGRVTVMDLGIVAEAGEAELSLNAIGTPRYMAPEMLSAAEVDGRADVYSLGVIAYHALTGAVPFDGPTAMAVLFKHAHEPFEPIRQRAPGVPRALAAAVERALAKEPGDRFASAAELAVALQGTLGGRSPLPWVLGGLAVVGLAVGAWLALRSPEAPRPDAALPPLILDAAVQPDAAPVDAAPVDAAPPPPDAAPATKPPKPPPQRPGTDRPPPDRPVVVDAGTVSIRVLSTPLGATVKEGGTTLGTTPFTLERPASNRTLVLSFSKAGYDDATARVSLARDGMVRAKLPSGFELVP